MLTLENTAFAFGVVFAGFAAIGRAELVFTCNAVSYCFFFSLHTCASQERLLLG